MPFRDPQNIGLVETLLFSLFAAVGGLLGYVLRTLNNEKTPTWFRSLIEALSSAFVGLIAMLACKAMGLDWRWSGVIVGVFGWIGAEASIAMLAKVVRRRLGIEQHDIEDNAK